MAADHSARGGSDRDRERDMSRQSAAAGTPGQETSRAGGQAGMRDREQRMQTTREGVEARPQGATEENARLARLAIESFNARDFDRAVRVAANDIECVLIPFNATRHGQQGFRDFFQNWATAFPDGQCEIRRVIADEHGAVIEYIGRGTQTGPLQGPGGTIQPTGRRAEVPFCDVLEIERGQIRRQRSYFDGATMMRQLGLLPESASGGQMAGSSTRGSTR
jgi:steroid delta-isomerase-like uncharacterized protein